MSEVLEDNKMVKIGNRYINRKNITYVQTYTTYRSGLMSYMNVYHMAIYFVDKNCIELETQQNEEFEEWKEKLL